MDIRKLVRSWRASTLCYMVRWTMLYIGFSRAESLGVFIIIHRQNYSSAEIFHRLRSEDIP